MTLFMANKQLFMGVSLGEIKKMTPQEAYVLEHHIINLAKQMELEKLKN
nr:MAG TPA: hypothetical protein [Caudoviricetes sp.]